MVNSGLRRTSARVFTSQRNRTQQELIKCRCDCHTTGPGSQRNWEDKVSHCRPQLPEISRGSLKGPGNRIWGRPPFVGMRKVFTPFESTVCEKEKEKRKMKN